MLEEKAKQFEKRPPSQFQQSKFYFRGGDVLHEQEYLISQYKQALADYRVAETQLKIITNQVEDAREVLNDQEGYTNALASFLEADTESSKREAELKKKLVQLEKEIDELNDEMTLVRAQQNQAALAVLQKEKAYYMIEIQRGRRSIESYNEQNDNSIRQTAACTINKKYRDALLFEYHLTRTQQKKSYLKQLVNSSKREFDSIRPMVILNDPESRTWRSDLLANIKPRIALMREKEREERREAKHKAYIDSLIKQIEELNERMTDLGMDEENLVETEELRTRCQNEDYSDVYEEDENEKGNADDNNNDNDNESQHESDNLNENESEDKNDFESENKNEPESDNKSEIESDNKPSGDEDDKNQESNKEEDNGTSDFTGDDS